MDLSDTQKEILLALDEDNNKAKEINAVFSKSRQALYDNLEKLTNLMKLVRKPSRGEYCLTEEGKEEIKKIAVPQIEIKPEIQNTRTKGLLNLFPYEAFKSLFQLTISTIYAKRNLLDKFSTGWGGVILSGGTKTFKTAFARAVVEAIGLDSSEVLKTLQMANPGEIGFRRQRTENGYKVETNEYFELPAIILDELDKADTRVKKAALHHCQADRSIKIEDQTIKKKSTSLITLNSEQPEDVVPDSFLRRSFILDTNKIPYMEDLEDKVRKVFNYLKENSPILNPEKAESREILGEKPRETLKNCRKQLLKKSYRGNYSDFRPYWIALHGRLISPLSQDESLGRSIIAVAYNGLLLADLAGGTVENWRDKLVDRAKEVTEDDELIKTIEEREQKKKKKEKKKKKKEAKIEERKEEQEEKRVKEDKKKYDRIGAKYRILGQLKNLHDALKNLGNRKANREVKPIRKKIDSLIADIKNSESREELEHYGKVFNKMKKDEDFKEAVKIARVRRKTDDSLKLEICNWENFLSRRELDKVDNKLGKDKKIEGESDKKRESKNQAEKKKSKSPSSGSPSSKSPTPARIPTPKGALSLLYDKIPELLDEKSSDDEEPEDEETHRYRTYEDL